MKIISIVGTRPQFIKLAPLSQKLQKIVDEIIIHTGQHFDQNMSKIFFDEMEMPQPHYHLGIAEVTHAAQTGKMLIGIETVCYKEKPDLVIVFGDTNSTVAGALAASKLCIPILHIEAGLRSFDKKMPEEQNRIVTDHLTDYFSCPSQTAVTNLKKEGITQHVYNTGDIMYDALIYFEKKANRLKIYEELKNSYPDISSKKYAVLTLHRPSNTDNEQLFSQIFRVLGQYKHTILFPVHPRARKKIHDFKIQIPPNIKLTEPLGYLKMLTLIKNASKVFTDSGGLQKEAFFLETPCITIRDTTEWMETVKSGWNTLVLDSPTVLNTNKFYDCFESKNTTHKIPKNVYGNGTATDQIINILQ